jgi:hypothetical protein
VRPKTLRAAPESFKILLTPGDTRASITHGVTSPLWEVHSSPWSAAWPPLSERGGPCDGVGGSRGAWTGQWAGLGRSGGSSSPQRIGNLSRPSQPYLQAIRSEPPSLPFQCTGSHSPRGRGDGTVEFVALAARRQLRRRQAEERPARALLMPVLAPAHRHGAMGRWHHPAFVFQC